MKCLLIPCAALIVSFALVSCGKSIDDMIDEYNDTTNGVVSGSTSGKNDSDGPLCPGDEGFDERDMLQSDYGVTDDGSLQLAAPHKCTSYSWVLHTADEYKEVLPFSPYPQETLCTEWTDRLINIYVPQSHLTDGMYALRLVVKGEDGKTYTDTAVISVYPKM